ncbi:hypothetical protein SSX86_030449 [Deinandra increscens subsp. villosa]|uniref:Uncharacterized protein n=1 Tax=Deinandra increscens subsp. villosa TaxID=3103831 RepID=A0AAP0GIL7_9ASTR
MQGDHHHHMEAPEDTISLSGLEEDNNIICPQQISSPSSFEQESFLGFFSEEWSRDHSHTTSPENIIFCGKLLSSKPSVSRNPETRSQTSAVQLFRSSSDSFRFMKTAITPRSKSLPNRLMTSSASCKSKWQVVFMFGFGSGKFPTTMDMSDIKSRQLRRQSTVVKEDSVGRKKGWWRLVDVLGCNDGYERERTVVI